MPECEHEYVGISEIAERLGVSRASIGRCAQAVGFFPEPVVRLKMGPVYEWADIEAWDKKRRRKWGHQMKPRPETT